MLHQLTRALSIRYCDFNAEIPRSLLFGSLQCVLQFWGKWVDTPTLPPIHIQVELGINKWCKNCRVAIDRRSTRCRSCHRQKMMARRFPIDRYDPRRCRNCNARTSRRRTRSVTGLCRACYQEQGRIIRPKRAVNRKNPGGGYEAVDGLLCYANEPLLGNEDVTVAAAWACLRKNWRAFKIAKAQGEEARMRKYASRIQQIAILLRILPPEFENLDLNGEEFSYENSIFDPDYTYSYKLGNSE